MKNYVKNTKKLVKNTIIVLVLGIILLTAYFFLTFNGSREIFYYTFIVVAVVFGLHLWLIAVSLHINHGKHKKR